MKIALVQNMITTIIHKPQLADTYRLLKCGDNFKIIANK